MWRNYVNFSDRTTVRGYWMAALINFLIGLLIGALIQTIPALTFVGSVYSLAAFLPALGLTVRRLRDAGKGWTWIFINLIPLVGTIIFIVILCKPSTPDNPTGAATV